MKLKETPNEVVVHTPTEAEAKELLALLIEEGYNVTNSLKEIKEANNYNGEEICFRIHDELWDHCTKEWYKKKRYVILTFAEFKERYVDLDDTFTDDCKSAVKVSEHETKTTEDTETKELDLCELLKGHEGEKIWSPIFGNGKVKCVECNYLEVAWRDGGNELTWSLSKGGNRYADGYCMIYPSRAAYEQYPLDPYTAWMNRQRAQMKFGLDIKFETYFEGKYGWEDCDDDESCLHFHTSADRSKCIEEIKAIIKKYSNK